MKSRFLFPHRFKLIGWIIAIPSLILGCFVLFKDFSFDFLTINLALKYYFADGYELNFTDEIAAIGSIVGMTIVAFSKVKIEDEYVTITRLESLQWAIYFNFGLLILSTIFVHGMAFFQVIIFNMFTPLVFFVVRFHFILFLKPRFEKN